MAEEKVKVDIEVKEEELTDVKADIKEALEDEKKQGEIETKVEKVEEQLEDEKKKNEEISTELKAISSTVSSERELKDTVDTVVKNLVMIKDSCKEMVGTTEQTNLEQRATTEILQDQIANLTTQIDKLVEINLTMTEIVRVLKPIDK